MMTKKEVEDALKADSEKGCRADSFGFWWYALYAVIIAGTVALIFYSWGF